MTSSLRELGINLSSSVRFHIFSREVKFTNLVAVSHCPSNSQSSPRRRSTKTLSPASSHSELPPEIQQNHSRAQLRVGQTLLKAPTRCNTILSDALIHLGGHRWQEQHGGVRRLGARCFHRVFWTSACSGEAIPAQADGRAVRSCRIY